MVTCVEEESDVFSTRNTSNSLPGNHEHDGCCTWKIRHQVRYVRARGKEDFLLDNLRVLYTS